MRISSLLPLMLLGVATSVSLAQVSLAQDSLQLNDGGWQPVRRGSRTYLTAPMTPVRLSVRSNRPTAAPQDTRPVQVTVGGATGNAIEASAFVRPIVPASQATPEAPALAQPSNDGYDRYNNYVPDPVTPASGIDSRSNSASSAYFTADPPPRGSSRATDGNGRQQPTSARASANTYAATGASNAANRPSVYANDAADTPPRLPPTPPQWNDPALEVARESLAASQPTPAAPQSVYWQGQAPADLPPRLPSNGGLQPAPGPPSSFSGGASVMTPAPQSFGPSAPQSFGPTAAPQTFAAPATPSCDAYATPSYATPSYAASPYTPYYPRTVASPSVPAYGAAAPMTVAASAYSDTEIRRGLLGQPVLRVPGQPLRNFLRFITP